MSKSDKKVAVAAGKPDNKRRNFLIGASLGGAAAAAAAASGVTGVQPAAKTADSLTEAAGKDKGYQETEHVRRYYGTTRI